MDCPNTHPTTPGVRELRPVQGSALICRRFAKHSGVGITNPGTEEVLSAI